MRTVARPKKAGMRGVHALASMSADDQLDLIAEGLPILQESAEGLLEASKAVKEYPRAADILQGQALEECAKILILMDVVRCPTKVRATRIGPMISWFYSHLARLIYLDAQGWKPVNVSQLQQYVDAERRSHYLEVTLVNT